VDEWQKKGGKEEKKRKTSRAAALYLDFPKAQPPIGSAPPISHLLTYQLAAQLAAICFQLLNKCGGGGGCISPGTFGALQVLINLRPGMPYASAI